MMEHMFDMHDNVAQPEFADPPADTEIDSAVARLVAAFGGGGLVPPKAGNCRPLSAA